MPSQNHNPSPGKRQTTTPDREAAIAHFWDQYIAIIHKKGIKEPFDRWFVIRARQYIEAFHGKCLALHSADDLNSLTSAFIRQPDGLRARRKEKTPRWPSSIFTNSTKVA